MQFQYAYPNTQYNRRWMIIQSRFYNILSFIMCVSNSRYYLIVSFPWFCCELDIKWKGYYKMPRKGHITHLLGLTKTEEKCLLEIIKKWIFINITGEILGKNSLFPPKFWENLLEVDCAPQHQYLASHLQQHDTKRKSSAVYMSYSACAVLY